jgi:hypothetical protein
MPFTPSHVAAAIPFRRTRLDFVAVAIGCMAPDFEYFLRLKAVGGYGHTLPGFFGFDLPVSLLALWLFHAFAKEPLYAWLPVNVRERIQLGPTGFPAENMAQYLMICISILIGWSTHLLWDSFTHPFYWPYQHWTILRRTVELPVYGPMEYVRVLQHASTFAGAVVLLISFIRWYRKTAPVPPLSRCGQRRNSRAVLVLVCALAAGAAILRIMHGYSAPLHFGTERKLFIRAVITTITIFWAEVVLYGAFRSRLRTE